MSSIKNLTTSHMGETLQMKMLVPSAAISYDELRLQSYVEFNVEMDQVDQLITSLEAFKKSHEKSRYKLKPEYRAIYGMELGESFLNKYDSSSDGVTMTLSTSLDSGGFQTLFTEAEFNELITPDHELYGKLEKVGE